MSHIWFIGIVAIAFAFTLPLFFWARLAAKVLGPPRMPKPPCLPTLPESAKLRVKELQE